jgi:hypothetical protein
MQLNIKYFFTKTAFENNCELSFIFGLIIVIRTQIS